ncbi:MAG: glutamine-hydrolyzing carbamoyl-phosphate synthase small subunit [Blastochloris sp.]|nr:glutamine-hydrolyzing carbamoyl-phosphate synthase small subunit [Blastochloris sp.]
MQTALLALEDGSVFRGESFGAAGTVTGEICFNTSMTGYQEILTDPSYKGQMVALTYPEIGNYGVNEEDAESYQPHVSGFIVRELSPIASNYRSTGSLADYLKKNGIPGIKGIDTRALTKKLRVTGSLKGILTTEEMSDADAVAQARAWHGLIGVDYVKDVTCKAPYRWDAEGINIASWKDSHELKQNPELAVMAKLKHKIVAYDFGIKYNILRRLREQGFDVTVVPARTTAREVMALKPEGVFLSNGPGDPAALTYAHAAVSEIIGQVPLFGICLGHQIMGHALGAKTFKLKFGHRGGNQPVQDVKTGKVTITSQNHGFAVDSDSIDRENVEVTHVNLNDGTCEGLRHKKHDAFSVQYHPEAAPGPNDATYFFEEFRNVIERFQKSV